MGDDMKGLFTKDQLLDITKLVGAADSLMDNPRFRRDMGDIHNLSLKNPVTDFETLRQSGAFDAIDDDEYMVFMEQTEFMSDTMWGGHPSVAINKEKMVEDLLNCALALQAIANRCIRANAIAQAHAEWHELADEFAARKNTEQMHMEVMDAIKTEAEQESVETSVTEVEAEGVDDGE